MDRSFAMGASMQGQVKMSVADGDPESEAATAKGHELGDERARTEDLRKIVECGRGGG